MENIKAFAGGFLVGGLLTGIVAFLYISKTKKIHEEEISSVIEEFRNRKVKDIPEEECNRAPETPKKTKDGASLEQKSSLDDYRNLSSKAGYFNYSKKDEPHPEVEKIEPFVIPEEEFGEMDYTKVTYICYADGIITDEDDLMLREPVKILGDIDVWKYLDDEDDAVYVRNDARRCDYEFLRSEKKYSDILEERPYLAAEGDD